MKSFILFVASCFTSLLVNAQSSALCVNQAPIHFDSAAAFVLQQMININPDDSGEGGEVNQFRRWTEFYKNRVAYDAPADSSILQPAEKGLDYFLKNTGLYCNSGGQTYRGNWNCIGPFNEFYGPNLFEHQGRIDAVWADPGDVGYMLAGSNMGGLWKSTDTGHTWNNITDYTATGGYTFPGTVGVNQLAVNPLNHNIIYIATNMDGTAHKSGGYAMGVSYTTDGGQTWQLDTDFQQANAQNTYDFSSKYARKLAYMPGTQQLFAISANKVLYKSTPSSSWNDITPTNIIEYTDFEFTVLSPGKLVVSTTAQNGVVEFWTFIPSTYQWSSMQLQEPTGFDFEDGTTFIKDFTITKDDSVYYIMGSVKNLTSNTYNNYLNRGTFANANTHSLVKNPFFLPSIIASPVHSNLFYGKISDGSNNFYKSINWTQTWTDIQDSTHADGRYLGIYSSGTNSNGIDDILLGGSDGGVVIKKAGSTNFESITGAGLAITQFYSFSNTEADDKYIAAGAQDNGVFSYVRNRNEPWRRDEGSDGFAAKFANNGVKQAYVQWWPGWGYLWRINFNGATTSTVNTNPPSDEADGHYLRAMYFDSDTNFYYGTAKLRNRAYSSSTWGYAFDQTNGDPKNDRVNEVVMKEPVHDTMYMSYWYTSWGNDPTGASNNPDAKLLRTFDGTNSIPSWDNITMGSVAWNRINDIEVNPNNMQQIWVAMGDVNFWLPDTPPDSTRTKVFYSSNAGDNWIDISRGLPPLPINKILRHQGTNTLYVATDVGVFYCDFSTFNPNATVNGINRSVKWYCFNSGMPPMVITDMEFNYCSGKLRIATFGRGIWETNILVDPYPANNPPTFTDEFRPTPQEVISSNTTWIADKYITTGVKITNNATLTISGSNTTIHMPANGVILVDRGATLVVDGATITNSCEKCMWAGINLRGNIAQPQGSASSHPNQGRVVLQNGATLEHARTAISNWSLDDPAGQATSGGIIHATGANFINNGRSAEFIPYQNYGFGGIPISDGSFFRNCTFNITNDYKGLAVNYPFKHHVTMWDVSGVKFYGNTFKNEHTGNLRGLGDGIYSYNSGFNATRYPLNLSQSANAFLDLKQGISIDGDMRGKPKSVLIDRNDFDGTTIGIMISNVENVTAIRNSFSVGNGRGIELLDCHDNIGIYATNTAQFRIEENVFTESTPKTADYTIGTLIHHSGGNDKELYKNSYNGLDYGILATGKNRVPYIATYPAGNTGLRILCNSFTGNTNDVGVSGNNTAPNYEGIAMFQGSNALSAGNRFNTSTSTHFNNTASSITYYYGPNNSNVIPSNFLPAPPQQNVFPIQATQDNGCASKLGGEVVPEEPVKLKAQDKSSIKNVFYTNQATRNSKLAQWNNTIDGGNTQYVIDEIPNLPHGYAAMNFMLQYAPYSSEQVLRVLAENDVMDKEMLKEVLAANPDVLRGREFLDFIQSGSVLQPMDESDMDYLFTYIENVTARTILESEISHHQAQMSNAVNLLITDIKNDEEGAEIDSLPVWYDRVGEAWAQYERAYHFLYKDDFAGANAIFNAIPTAFNYGTSESVEHERLYTIFDLLNTLKSEERSIYELGSDEIGILQDIRTASMLESHDIATSILAHTGIIDRFPCIDVYYPPASSMRQANRTATIKKSKQLLSVYPNPAKDYTVFEYTGKELASPIHVSVMNTMGQTVATVELKKGVATKTYWDTRALAAGNYFYQATDGKKKIGSGKFVITK